MPNPNREFNKIVEQYAEPLYKFARTILVKHEDANDCVQESFIKIWKKFDQLASIQNHSAWFYTIVRNTAFDILKKNGKYTISEFLEEEWKSKQSHEIEFSADEIIYVLEKAISDFTEFQQAVFRLRYYSELPFQTIAEQLGSTENSVKAIFAKMKKELTQQLTEWEQ